MPDEKVATMGKGPIEFTYQSLLGRVVKIDHDVPAKNHMEGFFEGKLLLEVQSLKADILPDLTFDSIISFPAVFPLLEVFSF